MSLLSPSLRRLLLAATLGLPLLAGAAPATDDIGRQWGECARPQFAAVMATVDKGFGGYAIQVGEERYWIAMVERATFMLQLAATHENIARIKISRPPLAEFDEQAGWRARWLEDVAARSAVTMERRLLGGGTELLSIAKSRMGGRFVGVSLIIDRQRKAFGELDWQRLERYASSADVLEMQETVWRQLLPCAFPALESAGRFD